MAYVNSQAVRYRRNQEEQEQPKPNALQTASTVVPAIMKGLEYVNKNNENFLKESGWLQQTVPGEHIDANGDIVSKDLFIRKPGKGVFRKAEDRIQLSPDGKEYFKDLAKNDTKNRSAAQLFKEHIEGMSDSDSSLKKVAFGSEDNLDKTIQFGNEAEETIGGIKDTGENLLADAKTRAEDFMNKYDTSLNQVPNIGVKPEQQMPIGDFSGQIGQSNISTDIESTLPSVGIRPDLINPNPQVNLPAPIKGSDAIGMTNTLDSKFNLTEPSTVIQDSTIMKNANKTGIVDKFNNFNPVKDTAKNIGMKLAPKTTAAASGLMGQVGALGGPMGFLASAVVGELGKKLFKQHTAVGKLFRIFG